jgi:hypothetical protein
MGHSVTTAATNKRLVQVATIKTLLGITSTEHDTTLAEIADRASDAIISHCDREFALQTYTETLSGDGSNFLVLRHSPLQSVTSVALRGDTATDFSIDDKEDGILFRELGWQWTIGLSKSLGEAPQPGAELNKWTVIYVAGYDMPGDTSTATGVLKLPKDVEQAAIQTVKHWFKGRKREDINSKSVGALSIQYALDKSSAGLPPSVEGLLRKWEWLEGY